MNKLIQGSFAFFLVGATVLAPVYADLVEKIEYTVNLQTTQKKIDQKRNTTSNNITWTRETNLKTTFDSKQAIEKIRESTKSSKFKVTANISGSYGGTDASASAESEFESLVKQYYKETGEVAEHKEVEKNDKEDIILSPRDLVTYYKNTTQGGGYSHSWETTELLTDEEKKPHLVKLVATRDLTAVFNEMLNSVIQDTSGISTDSDEWGQFSKTCQDAKLKKSIRAYCDGVLKGGTNTRPLWTSGLDQNSWAEVIRSARIASTQKSDADALQVVLLGFYNVRSPSHNAWAWDHLKGVAGKYLIQ